MPLIRMKACGNNQSGQLGDGTTIDRHVLTPVQLFALPLHVAGGGIHSLALLADGTVWAWGNNVWGQLGDGTRISRSTPVQVVGPGGEGFLSDIIAIAAASALSSGVRFGHSLALKADGTVWAWGYNGQGQLGDGTTTERTTPVQVVGLTDVVAIAAGIGPESDADRASGWSLAVKADGTVWAWGDNTYGKLGDGTTTSRSTPVQVVGPGGAGFLTDVIAVAAGGGNTPFTGGGVGHSLALKADGTVWAWGYNLQGQLGDGTTTHRNTPVQVVGPGGIGVLSEITAIAAGGGSQPGGHSLALKADGTVWAWGNNA